MQWREESDEFLKEKHTGHLGQWAVSHNTRGNFLNELFIAANALVVEGLASSAVEELVGTRNL